MRITIIILLAVTSLLSACSNHKKNTDEQITNHDISHGTVAVKPVEALPQPDLKTTVIETEVVQIDLLDRIRRGFEFPEINSEYTDDYVKWSVNHPTYLTDLFIRAEPFLYYIVEEIDNRGLPMELALLPAIESAFKPNAISRSNAGGLWQFIPSTGRDFGLTQDWWFDGRRDFIMSTNAALDYLTQLNSLFDGDWYHTLAAYNAGQGTVLRAISANERRGRNTDYQSLDLREETIKYIPKLQALKNIIVNPEKYNVSLAKIENQPYFEIVPLPGQVDIHDFTKQANLNINEVKHLNAGHLRWATSPEGPHRLLLPLSNQAQTAIALEKIKLNPTVEFHQHTISSGETLSQIGSKYGVTVSALQTTNNLNGTSIRAGKALMIPIANGAKPQTIQSASNIDSQSKVIHRVVKGDTLWSISKRYNVALNQLLSWNQLTKNQILKLNQALLIFSN